MRQKRPVMLKFYFLAAVLYFQAAAFARQIDENLYHYPYKDPYLATTTVGIMQGSENLQASEIKDLRIKILDHRDAIPLAEGMGTLRYRFYQQKEEAPLIFIIPGLAGSAYSGTVRFLAEWLADNGFHALVLPSPFNWNFTLAASVSGYPGHTREDTKDLYSAMQSVLTDVKIRCHARIGKIGVLGLSDGALYAAYLSKLDSRERRIGVDTFLLVNPPVDLFETAKKIHRMADAGKNFKSHYKNYLESYAFGVVTDALGNDISDPGYYADWNNRFRLRDRQIEYLIGKNIQDSVGDALYVMSLANDATIFKTPVSWGYRGSRLEEARSFGLMRYVDLILIPRLWKKGYYEINLKTLDKLNSIRGIELALRNNKAVYLMHNLDDVLVSVEDIAYLEKIFAERAIIYPHGGHLGNLWYPENKKHLLDIFQPLLRS